MVSAIISDTLLFKSAITTDEDIETVKYLSDYFKFDYQTLGRELLARGADVSDLTEEEIINLDSKAYMVNGYDIQIAVLNSVDVDSLLKKRKEKILNEINKFIKEKKKQLFALVIIDILELNSTALVNGEYINVFEKAFNVSVVENEAFLQGVTSRKKEIYPPIAKQLQLLPKYDGGDETDISTFIKLNWLLLISLSLLI